MRANKQRNLPFDGNREQDRLDRIERLLGKIPKVKTATKFFDYDEATQAARSAIQSLDACIGGKALQCVRGGAEGALRQPITIFWTL